MKSSTESACHKEKLVNPPSDQAPLNPKSRKLKLERVAESGADWWAREGAVLARLGTAEEFPLASRIGTAAGQALGAAIDPQRAFEFGLSVILDGLKARIASSG